MNTKRLTGSILLVSLSLAVQAQVSFSAHISMSGNACDKIDADIVRWLNGEAAKYAAGGNFIFPRRAECERVRATIHGVSGTYHYKGRSCTARWICTPCTGRELSSTTGQANIYGVEQGGSFNSVNGAEEAKNWSSDFIERMLALNPDFVNKQANELSMGSPEIDGVRNQVREKAFFRPINARNDEALLPYTDAISMAQTHILELAGMTSSELHEKLTEVEKYITAEYNQKILELNRKLLFCEIKTEYAFINALCNKNMPENARKEYEAKIEKMKEELINKYGVSLEDIEKIQDDSKSWITETAKMLDDDREIPQGFDLNKITELFANLNDHHTLKELAELKNNLESEKKALDFNYNNEINKLENVTDLLNIQQGKDHEGKVTYGSITAERASDVMSWYGDNGKDVFTLFPEKFVDMFIEKETKIEIK